MVVGLHDPWEGTREVPESGVTRRIERVKDCRHTVRYLTLFDHLDHSGLP